MGAQKRRAGGGAGNCNLTLCLAMLLVGEVVAVSVINQKRTKKCLATAVQVVLPVPLTDAEVEDVRKVHRFVPGFMQTLWQIPRASCVLICSDETLPFTWLCDV